MAEALTYSSLLTDVQAWAERSDPSFVAQIPRFVMYAENKIAAEVRNLGFVRYASSSFSPNNPVMNKPERWRQTIAFKYVNALGKWAEVKPRSYDYCRAYWPDQSQVDSPLYFADYDYEHYFVVPTPSQAFSLEIAYHERPMPLDNGNQTNWTTQYAPQLLLYATLVEASTYLKNVDKVQLWKGFYDDQVAKLGNEEIARTGDNRNGERKQA